MAEEHWANMSADVGDFSGSTDAVAQGTGTRVIYSEKQRVPLGWWLAAAGVVIIIAWQAQMGRSWWWFLIAAIISAVLAIWGLVVLSKGTVEVLENSHGQKWLKVSDAIIPAEVIDRTLVIPPTAKQAALGRQLDPAAFVVHKGWIPTMAMMVLDDPVDPTPYWLVSTKNPQELLEALGRPIY